MKFITPKGESLNHIKLKQIARRKLEKLKCKNITEEFLFVHSTKEGKKRYWFDLIGIKGRKMYVIECGLLSKTKQKFIESLKDVKFIHMPYKDYKLEIYEEPIIEIKIIKDPRISHSIYIKDYKWNDAIQDIKKFIEEIITGKSSIDERGAL